MAIPEMTLGAAPQALPAGLGKRIAAYLIDLLIVLAVLLLVGITSRFLRARGLWTPSPPANDPVLEWQLMSVGTKLLVFLTWFVATGLFYFMALHSSAWQATLGKRLVRIYLTDDNSVRISLARAAARRLVQGFLGFFGGTLVSLVTIAVTAKKEALHDLVVHTLVLEGRPPNAGEVDLWRWLVAFALPFVLIMVSFMITM